MQVKPTRILWPTDFSELSLHAGRYARAMADQFGAELHIVHVVPPPLSPDVAVMVPADAPMTMTEPKLLDASRAAIKELIIKHFDGDPKIVTHAYYGNPWPTICEYAKEKGIDLIVVSTHGRTGISHVLIGSTAERIVQHAPCAVLTVKRSGRGFLNE
ncbi:MAG: universal stress protein [Phycisphaerae bacterium]